MLEDETQAPADPPEAASQEGQRKVRRLFKPKPKPMPKLKLKPRTFEREQSSISFPYMDLESGIAVAQAIREKGAVPLNRHQLAGAMKLSVDSGNFVTKVATARIFGLIVNVEGAYKLTDLGHEILDEKRQRAARATAFLTAPLYRRTFEEFKGRLLPPRPHGLEQAFGSFGVAPKQRTNARLAFEKSAKQAGFFDADPDRLIEPIVGGQQERAPQREEYTPVPDGVMGTPGAIPQANRHPFIQGLLDTLPEPNTNWTIEGRAKWLQAAANIFDLIYKGSGTITIVAREPTNQGEPFTKE